MLSAILFVAGAYLLGAVPSAYLVGQYLKGIDIRRYGSGNVGATNVIDHVGKLPGLSLGAFDCLAKGTLPVVLSKVLGQSLEVQLAVGLASIFGHNWSPYIRFTGGRGVATAIGVIIGLMMWQEFIILCLVLGIIGRYIFRDTGFFTLLSLLALPLLAYLFNRPSEILYATVMIGVLILVKRLTANWESSFHHHSVLKVVVCRILWDRDVPQKGR